MKKQLFKSFFLILMFGVFFMTSCTENKKNTDFMYYFENTENDGVNTPITKIPVNGVYKYFIIDTGANMSMIDETYYLNNKNDFQFLKELDMTIQGVVGGKDVKSSYIVGELGDSIRIKHHFITSDLRGVISNINSACGYKIIGIIGSDYLLRYNFSVDFRNRAIYRNILPLDSIIKKEMTMK